MTEKMKIKRDSLFISRHYTAANKEGLRARPWENGVFFPIRGKTPRFFTIHKKMPRAVPVAGNLYPDESL